VVDRFSFSLVLVHVSFSFVLVYAYSHFVRSPLTIAWYLSYLCYIFRKEGRGEIRVLRKPGEKRKEGELLNIYPSS